MSVCGTGWLLENEADGELDAKAGVGGGDGGGTVYPWRDALPDFAADALRSVSEGEALSYARWKSPLETGITDGPALLG